MPTIRIANGAGFLGDWLDAPQRLVKAAEVDYLTIEHLAELTMSILARQREKNPNAGYAEDFLKIVRSLVPALKKQSRLKIVANSGGVNPPACVAAVSKVLAEAGLGETSVACVTGDDLLPRLAELRARGCDFANLDTGQSIPNQSAMVAANAYLGARPIADALAAGARIVVTGRVADASLTVGPAMHEFGWQWNDWNKLAAASVAGHLIECGAQVTGGYTTDWQRHSLAEVGYPIAELTKSGDAVITKPPGTGGAVTWRTVIEQLVYEIGDPKHYLTPDVDCNFTTVEIKDLGNDRVAVAGASGQQPTDNYKVSMAYHDGFMASGTLLVFGSDCQEKARACGEIILRRCELAGNKLARTNIELLGAGDGVPGAFVHRKYQPPGEVVVRVTAHDARREAVECFAEQFAALITSGPAGLAGYAAGRPQVRPLYAYWPTLVPKSLIRPHVEVRKAKEWAS